MAKAPLIDPSLPLFEAIERLREAFMVTDAELDPPGPRILLVNEAFCRMTGYSRDELLGQTPRVLQGPETDREVLDRVRRCLQQGESFEGQAINYRKDGSPFDMRWYIEPIRDVDGQISHFCTFQHDITKELAASKQKRALEQAISQLTDAVVLFGHDGRINYANNAYLEWCGRRPEEVIEAPIWRLPGLPPNRIDLRWARDLLKLGKSWQREYEVRRSTGNNRRFIFVTVSPICDQSGQVAEFVAVGRDVTEQRRLESIVEAHNFHDHLGVVFAGIRHELGNPINSTKTALQVVIDGLETMPQAKLRNYLERMREEISRVEYLLRCLRSYNLYDKPRFEEIDVRAFVTRFQQLAQADLRSRSIELKVEIEISADTIWADPQALHQVLLNVIGNAGAALEGQSGARVEIRAGSLGPHGVLIIRDNGPGIPADTLPHVFKPFFTTRSEGTGLGLAISRHLLSLMRGSIELMSSSEGTEVRILLDRLAPEMDSRGLRR